MARIRTLKPEFWGDEKLSPMTPIDRLVFLGLISMADDAGRIVDNVKSIDGFIFPETTDSSRNSLESLANTSRIVRYASDSGQRLIQIRHWGRHQRVDKPSRYVLPEPTCAQLSGDLPANVSRDSRVPTLDHGPTTSDQRPTTASPPASSVADEIARNVEKSGGPLLGEPDAETALALRLETDADRVALTVILAAAPFRPSWLAEIAATLDGMHGPPLTPPALGAVLRDYVGNGHHLDRPNFKHFRAYLRNPDRPDVAAGAIGASLNGRGTAGRSSADIGGEASLILGKLRDMVEKNDVVGQGIRRFIRRAKVLELEKDHPKAVQAYDAIGGADAILNVDPSKLGFLTRDFTAALKAARDAAA